MKKLTLALLASAAMALAPQMHATTAVWTPDPDSPSVWWDLDNWSGWDPLFEHDRPYPQNYPHLGIEHQLTAVITDYVQIPLFGPTGHNPFYVEVENLNFSSNGRAYLDIHGHLQLEDPSGMMSLLAAPGHLTRRGVINCHMGLVGTNDDILDFENNARLNLVSYPHDYYVGLNTLEIAQSGLLALEGLGARIFNSDNFGSDSLLLYDDVWFLEQRVRRNFGTFIIRDRTWYPDPAFELDFEDVQLENSGALLIQAINQPTRVGGLDSHSDSPALFYNSGEIWITAAPGLTATLDTAKVQTIDFDSSIILEGPGAQVGVNNDALQHLTNLHGGLQLYAGAVQQGPAGLLSTAALTLDQSFYHGLLEYSVATLSLYDADTAFSTDRLNVLDGSVYVGAVRQNAIGNYDQASFEDSIAPGVLAQPSHRAARGVKSFNLAAGIVALTADTIPGKTYVLTFETYGGLEARDGVVTVIDVGWDTNGSPVSVPFADMVFSAPAVSSFAEAGYETRTLTFTAMSNVTVIEFAAEDALLSGVGPVIDAVVVMPQQAGESTLEVPVQMVVGSQARESAFGYMLVGDGIVHTPSISLRSNGAIDIEGGVIRGMGENYTSITTEPGTWFGGYGDVYCPNLGIHGVLRVFFGEDEYPAGGAPFQPLTVHGKVTLHPGSTFEAGTWDENASPLKVVPGGGGDGSIALNGKLEVTYLYDNPPLPSAVITIIDATNITGSFTNLLDGRVVATASKSTPSGGEHSSGSFHVTITGTTVTLSDFATGPLFTLNGWATANNLPTGQQGAAHDPDRDGRSNLLEYALNTSPTSSGSDMDEDGTVNVTEGEEASVFRYVRPAGVLARPDVVYRVLASTDLALWTLVPAANATVNRISPTEEEVSVTFPTNLLPSDKQFMRLEVSSP